jgi:hypothetical protein
MKRRNTVHDAKHHAAHNGKSQKKADRGHEQPSSRAIRNMLAQQGAYRCAAKNKNQPSHGRQKNRQQNPVKVHASLNRDRDASGKLSPRVTLSLRRIRRGAETPSQPIG